MTVQDDDQLLVCRNSTPYNLKSQNVMAELLDDDLMLVCRNGTPYKATGLDIKESIGPQEAPPSLTSATLVDDNPTGADRYSNSSFTTTLNWATKGVPEASVEMQATVTGELDIAGATSEIVGINGNTLTLASDANLANGAFKAGDAVKQSNSPIVPVSSPIVGITSAGGGGITVYANTARTDTEAAKKKGTKYRMNINDLPTGSEIYTIGELFGGFPPEVVAQSVFEIWGYPDVDGSVAGSRGSFGLVEEKTADVWTSGFRNGNAYSYVSIASLGSAEPDGTDIGQVGEQPVTTLTLTNSDGLNDFAVGDVVSSAPITANITAINIYGLYDEDGNVGTSPLTSVTEAAEIGEQNYFNSDINDANKSGDKGFYVYDVNTITIAYSGLTAGDSIGIVAGGASGGASAAALNMSATGDVNNSGNPFVVYDGGGSKDSLPKTRSNIIVNASSGSFVLKSEFASGTTSISNVLIQWIEGLSEGVVSITAISESTPSITTDGGTWSVGEVVTGPTTDITATFVSADAAAKTMTVSNVVGPWSANTGNYVVNTVVNPVMIKPETSAIAAVTASQTYLTVTGASPQQINDDISAGIYSTGSYDPGKPLSTYVSPNGQVLDAQATPNDIFDEATVVLTFNPPLTGLPVLNVYGGARANSAVQCVKTVKYTDGTEDTVTGNSSTNYWYWVDSFNTAGKDISQVTFYATNDLVVGGVTAGDNNFILSTSSTVLTLTDDTDLNQFATGDNIYAAGVAPMTFAPVLYTGNAGTQDISVGFAPDLVWIKARGTGGRTDHTLFDTVRGAGYELYSNFPNGQNYETTSLTAFNSDGFSLNSSDQVNDGSNTYVAWCWDAGDTTVTNNDGTIESQVRSNGDFSIIKYKGTGDDVQTIGHGLSSPAKFVICKNMDASGSWYVGHEGAGWTTGAYLQLADSFASSVNTRWWNSTAPDSSVITLGQYPLEGANEDYIAYCWAESPTQSFGSYTGNGGTQTIECGFEPAFVMVKSSSNSEQWQILDSARNPSNPRNSVLYPNLSASEVSGATFDTDFSSTGFTLKNADAGLNYSGYTYIYAAFASAGGPSGVVGNITGLDMTLSESTGAWEVGQKVTMDEKPAVISTANVIFDQTGAVSGISTLPVAGQLILNKDTPKLTFTTPGTGQTWDEELPAGTKLQTSFVATNTEGSSSATSNVVTPGVTTLLAMGETTTNKEEIAQTIVQMETFDERKAIVEGETAKNKIERKVKEAQDKVKKTGL